MNITMTNRYWVLILFVGSALCAAQASDKTDSTESRSTCEELSIVAHLTESEDIEKHIPDLLATAKSGDRPSNMIAAAALFAHGQEEFWSVLLDCFAVRDYAQRSRGTYNFIAATDMAKVTDTVSDKCSSIEHNGLKLLMAFDYFRDRNEWIRIGEQNISVARFFRSAYLTSQWAATDVNAVEVANRIDWAVQEQLKAKDSANNQNGND